MKSYDYNLAFSPYEFQNFARDIVQIKEHMMFESFAEGRDCGIDGRNVAEDGYTTILQAKQNINMSSQILRIMKREKEKMDHLVHVGKRVDRYVLVLSDDIGPEKKEKIIQIMFPYIKVPGDIIDRKDINNLLGMPEYKTIEGNYYQLWIPSANILNRQLFQFSNGALVERSKIDYEKILNKKNIFVGTEFFKEVLQKILVNRVVIISGEPGVGKTTLAEQAALFYLGKYHSEIFFSVKSVDDIYRTLLVDGKKVIFYDDFWGGNGLIDFDIRNTSRELVRVIERINKTRDCILIMTTREYILEQGLKQNEELRKLIEKHKLECQITQYSEADRLKIYYGHLKLADLTWNQMLALKECDDYVVYSKNYNPRVLELFFKNYVKNDIKPKKCVDSLKKYLECPMDFWEDTFRGLSKEAGILYIMMAVMPMPVELEILEECYNNYIKRNIDVYEWKNFQDTVIELEKTVIRTDLYAVNWSGMIAVTFQNPSVKDFLIEFLKKNLIQYQGILEGSCKYYAQYVEYLRILDKVNAPIDIYI